MSWFVKIEILMVVVFDFRQGRLVEQGVLVFNWCAMTGGKVEGVLEVVVGDVVIFFVWDTHVEGFFVEVGVFVDKCSEDGLRFAV